MWEASGLRASIKFKLSMINVCECTANTVSVSTLLPNNHKLTLIDNPHNSIEVWNYVINIYITYDERLCDRDAYERRARLTRFVRASRRLAGRAAAAAAACGRQVHERTRLGTQPQHDRCVARGERQQRDHVVEHPDSSTYNLCAYVICTIWHSSYKIYSVILSTEEKLYTVNLILRKVQENLEMFTVKHVSVYDKQ